MELMAGAGMAAAVTLKGRETLPLAVVTVTVPAPTVALAATLTGRLIKVAETVAGPVVIPALLKLTVAPMRFPPAMVTVWFTAR
jgi:hypothetical protein